MENLVDRCVLGASAVTKKVVGQGGRSGVWALLGLAQHLKGQQQLFWEKATSQQECPECCIQKPKTGVPAMTAPLCGSRVLLSPSLVLICSKFSGQSLSDHREAVSFVVQMTTPSDLLT